MKTKKMLLAFLSAALLITAAGCQQSDNTKDSAEDKKTETTAAPTEKAKLPADGTLAQDTADDGEVPPSDEKPSTAPDETVNAASDQEISSVPETSSEAEGSPDFTLASFSDAEEHQTGEEISFTAEDLSYLFTVTDASFTDQRDEHAASQPDSVVLITYEYTPVSGSALLVDDMSFQLFLEDGTACELYYFPDQQTPSLVSAPESCTAQIAYGVPEGTKEAILCYRDSSHEELPSVKIPLKFS